MTKTKAQIIEKNGKPIFAVIPYEDYLALLPENSSFCRHTLNLIQRAKRPCIKGSRDFTCLQSENPGWTRGHKRKRIVASLRNRRFYFFIIGLEPNGCLVADQLDFAPKNLKSRVQALKRG